VASQRISSRFLLTNLANFNNTKIGESIMKRAYSHQMITANALTQIIKQCQCARNFFSRYYSTHCNSYMPLYCASLQSELSPFIT